MLVRQNFIAYTVFWTEVGNKTVSHEKFKNIFRILFNEITKWKPLRDIRIIAIFIAKIPFA